MLPVSKRRRFFPALTLTLLGFCLVGCAIGLSSAGAAESAAGPTAAVNLARLPIESPSTKPLSFTRDVQPALTKAGCNMGACHGSFQGRGGLSLSLLGYDAPKDYEALFLLGRGRRANSAAPDQSLLLQKAAARVPHGGGLRFVPESESYALVRRFLAEGCRPPQLDDGSAGPLEVTRIEVTPREAVLKPGESLALRVQAVWNDGVVRDVSPWALYDVRDKQYAEITADGRITALKAGRVPATIRYMGQVAAVDVTDAS